MGLPCTLVLPILSGQPIRGKFEDIGITLVRKQILDRSSPPSLIIFYFLIECCFSSLLINNILKRSPCKVYFLANQSSTAILKAEYLLFRIIKNVLFVR
jgi:hypothetical protein